MWHRCAIGSLGVMNRVARYISVSTAALLLSSVLLGCSSGQPGGRVVWEDTDEDADGVLWRQIAALEDPFSEHLFSARSLDSYVDDLGATIWDGTSDADDLGIDEGALIVYNVEQDQADIALDVFISSGPRPNVPDDDGATYTGPGSVFTCYRVSLDFSENLKDPTFNRTEFDHCPAALVAEMRDDAAFAYGSVFDG